jgi:hypothetical protein
VSDPRSSPKEEAVADDGNDTHGEGRTRFDDWLAIHTLIMDYIELADAGRFEEMSAMFEHATYRIAQGGGEPVLHRGREGVLAHTSKTRLYADGTPRTRHVTTNVNIKLDGDVATSRSNLTVFQRTDTLPLQPIAAGYYVDRFEYADGAWRFADRFITGFLVGDTSQHKDRPPS